MSGAKKLNYDVTDYAIWLEEEALDGIELED